MRTVLLYNVNPEWSAEEREEADGMTRRLGFALRRHAHSVAFAPLCDADVGRVLAPYDPAAHLVFNWCEELPGYDHGEALAAEAIETLGFAYTGATGAALRLSYDKIAVKRLLDAQGIATPRWAVFQDTTVNGWSHFPAIVKPAHEHCSYGVGPESVVCNTAELRRRVWFILQEFGQPALVEDFIDGREFHVSLWGNDSVEMLPPAEMDFSAFRDMHDHLCSYAAKFCPASEAYRKIRTVTPAPLDAAETAALAQAATAAYRAVGCRDYGRIDARLRDGVMYVLDVNPNADISADASMALAAEKAGYSYGAMGGRVLELAARRMPQSQNFAPHQ